MCDVSLISSADCGVDEHGPLQCADVFVSQQTELRELLII